MVVRDLKAELASPKYAHIERERRWLVDSTRRPDISGASATIIDDLYLQGSRLRLRKMTRPDGTCSCKLTKKYESDDPQARAIVTAYLTFEEFTVLGGLAGYRLRKFRHDLSLGGLCWSLDIFEGALTGLEILEIEAEDEGELLSIAPPPWATKEVTHDFRYQCGTLAQAQIIPE